MVEKVNPGLDKSESKQNSLHIPPEIVEHIISELEDDKPSLSRCSLICRAWTPHTRHRLFHEVGFRSPLHVFNDKVQEERLSRFIELCSNSLSTIPSAGIRVFELPSRPIKLFQWLSTPINTKATIAARDRLFSKLQHLKLINDSEALAINISQLQASESSIKHLTVTDCGFQELSNFLSIITCFPILERMTLDNVTFHNIRQECSIDFPHTFRHLDISPIKGLRFQRFRIFPLSTLWTYSGLRELSVPLTKGITSDLEYILTKGPAAAIGSIKRCTFRVSERSASANFQSFIQSLFVNARIPEIVVEGSIFGVDKFMEWIYTLDSEAKPCHSRVTEIALNEVYNVSDGWIREIPLLPRMDTVWVTHPIFRSLKEIRVDLVLTIDRMPRSDRVPPRKEDIWKLKAKKLDGLRGLMPRCSERGLLRPTVRVRELC